MYHTLILITLLPALVLSSCNNFFYNTENVRNCGADHNLPQVVQILGCDSAPCALYRGKYYVTFVKFAVPRNVTTFTPTLKSKIGLFVINYTFSNDIQIGCNWIIGGGPCPLQPGREIVYKLQVLVDPASPTLFAPILTFNLVDQNNISFACWTWEAFIV